VGYKELLADNRDFRNLWFGQLVSEIGDWFNNIALLAIVIELTNSSAVAIALYVIARHLPLFIFGPIAGVVSDRLSRRGIMIAADLVRAGLALSFILVHSRQDLWIVYASTGALTVLSVFFTAAKQASIPNVVARRHLLIANALSNSTTGLTLAVGSGLGGIVATQFGRNPVFVLNSISFLFSFLMILLIHIPQPSKTAIKARKSMVLSSWHEFRDGLSYIRSVPIVFALMWLTAGWSFGNGAARVVYPIFGSAFARAEHRTDDFGISVLYVAMGLGSVLGTLVVGRFLKLEDSDLTRTLGLAVLWDGLCLVLFSMMQMLWMGALLMLLREVGYSVWRTAKHTELMRETVDSMRGRVFAMHETISALLMMLTMVLAGPAIDRVGHRIVTATAGTIITAAGIIWMTTVATSRGYLARRQTAGIDRG